MKRLFIALFIMLSAISIQAQTMEVPVNCTDSTSFQFLPTHLKFKVLATNLTEGTADLYVELKDSTQNDFNRSIYKNREFKIRSNVQVPLSVLSSAMAGDQLNVPLFNQLLGVYKLEVDTIRLN